VYRVIQWTTGNVGRRAVRAIVEHPELELVGLYAHGADKVGRDAGELCGLPRLGVRATRDVDELLALRADCVNFRTVVELEQPTLPALSREPDRMDLIMICTAMPPILAIPYVCRAKPGIVTYSELPTMGARGLVVP